MGVFKWIGGAVGFAWGSALGGFLGFGIGALLDQALEGADAKAAQGEASGGAYDTAGGGQHSDPRQERNSFLFSLLVLSSYIIRADGKVMHSEMEFVREFLRRSFGEQAVGQGNEILLRLFEMQKQRGMDSFRQNIVQSCQEIRVNTDEGVRLQLLYYLVGVAKADNVVTPEEVNALQELAYHLGIDPSEVVSMLNLDGGYSGGGQTATENDKLAEAYKVLGVDPSATNDEVKAAYRKMALKHHPDRVAALGEDVRKSAERKFQEINDAKERVYASRGMN